MTGGLYARSLSLGLTSLLGPYLEKLNDIELQLLADPGLTLACLVSQLDEVCTCSHIKKTIYCVDFIN